MAEHNNSTTTTTTPSSSSPSGASVYGRNMNQMNASDSIDMSGPFGQQLPARETQYHPQEARNVHQVGLDMQESQSHSSSSSSPSQIVAGEGNTAQPQNNTETPMSNQDSTTTEQGEREEDDEAMASEGGLLTLTNNVVANKSDINNTNRNNKYNNNNCTTNNKYNNNSDSVVVGVGIGACDDDDDVDDDFVECGETMMGPADPRGDPQRIMTMDPSSYGSGHQMLPSSSILRSREASPSSTTQTSGDEKHVVSHKRRAFFDDDDVVDEDAAGPNNSLSCSSSAPPTGPAEAPTTRSHPTRRSTPSIPSLELQPEVTFQLQQQQRQAGISGTPNTTPTSAIMRTPPSPRAAAVILPLPRVTVTSPSDMSPACHHDSSTTLTMDEDDTVTNSPPSPQSPTSPTIPLTPPPTPPPPQQQQQHRSVVIIPMSTNPMLTTANGMISIGMLDQGPDMIDLPPPPPYEGVVKADDSNRQSGNYGLSHMDTLPSYAVATDLPTYEEAERAKANEMRESRDQTTAGSHLSNSNQQSGGPLYPDDVPAYDPYHLTGVSIGTDWIFLCTFAISFLFNWLGFLISLCITNTVAGRCGALSGLGLSMVKWVVIMKHNTMAQGFLQGDSWVWWILVVCGFLLFLRGCIQYVNMKYEWKRIFTRLQQMYFS